MLIRSFHPMPFKEFLHSISDPGMPEMCPKCDDNLLVSCSKSLSDIEEEKKEPNGLCSSSALKSTEESSLVTVSGNRAPRFVYKRKKRRGLFGSVNVFLDKVPADTRIGDSYSTIVCEAPGVEKEACAPPSLPSFDVDARPTNGCSMTREHEPDERLIQVPKIIDVDSVNESCSSRSNVELVSVPRMNTTDETGECSSSSVIVVQAREDNSLSERDFCISVLKSDGLLETTKSSSSSAFEDENDRSTDKSCGGDIFCNCILCSLPGSARKMLICDSCDEAFHLSCCNSRMRSFRDDDEWFCTSCQSQKHFLGKSRGNTMRLTRISSESGRPNPPEELSLISLMLRDTEPYRTSVRVGKGFQADIPEWTGPVKGVDMFGEPEKLDTSVQSNFHVFPSHRQPRLSSIGNWLQCKQVMDDKGETICGKWRRAPLFEVQTDDWECFCAVFWDPSHADCVVPQEVDTEQVLKQLKYIEMLRPQLASKRRKLARPQVGGSRLSAGASKKYRERKTCEEVCKHAEHKVSDPTQTT